MNFERVLKPEYQELADDYEDYSSRYGCSCHINPPCSACTHEGHPIALEENPDAWENPIVAAVRYFSEKRKAEGSNED